MGPVHEENQLRIEQACQAAQEFSKLYYETIDKKRHLLIKLYEDKAEAVWNGNHLTGKEAILKFYEDLPTSEHKLDSLDSQPISCMFSGDLGTCEYKLKSLGIDSKPLPSDISGGQLTIIVKTYGIVKYTSSNSKSFHQSFIMTSLNNVWKIVSDTFRFQDKSDV